MANKKTFISISNREVYDKVCSIEITNSQAHQEILTRIDAHHDLLNKHLYEHKLKAEEIREREIRERWLWGIIITIVGIAAGFIGSLL